MKCPKCETPMVGFLDRDFFPTGCSGAGIWNFRRFKMWVCNSCERHFHEQVEMIRSYPIDNPDGL